MVALLVLAADRTANGGIRILLFLLLMLAILLIVAGAIIAVATMYIYWKERSGKAEVAARADTLPGE